MLGNVLTPSLLLLFDFILCEIKVVDFSASIKSILVFLVTDYES